MNQKQRDFLIDQVRKNHRKEEETLNKQRPEEPSLNNYITAAILDGTFKLRPTETIRKTIKERVLKLGKKGSLLGSGRSSWKDDDEDDDVIELKAKDFFELPPGYTEAYDEYTRRRAEFDKKADDLDAMRDTLTLKIQIGSDKVLDQLIEQADNLADLSLMQTSLILKESQKQLTK